MPYPMLLGSNTAVRAVPAGVIHKADRYIGVVRDLKGRDLAALDVGNNLPPLLLGVLGRTGHVPVVLRHTGLVRDDEARRQRGGAVRGKEGCFDLVRVPFSSLKKKSPVLVSMFFSISAGL